MATKWFDEPARRIPVCEEVDVLVVGGGMSGCSAAVAAARGGARTLLLERWGFLGGTATASMVGVLCGVYTCGPESTHKQIIFGQTQELMERLERSEAGFKYRHRFQMDHEVLKLTLDEWLLEAGVKLLLQTLVVGPLVENGEIKGVIIENKGGRQTIRARIVIDSSGDADVAAAAGSPWQKGGELQAPTYVFYMGGVEIDRAMAVTEPELKEMLQRTIDRGEFSFARISGSYSPSPKPNTVHVNMTRVPGVDGTDPEDLTHGHLDGRRQVRDYVRFLKKEVPGFESAYLDSIAPQLGIRETRRITGEHILTREEVLGAKKFDDAICRGSWPIEDHTHGLDTIRLHLPGDDYYQVPYRCLVPLGVENLLVTGRCLSATRGALASVRVMGPGIATGHATGIAATIALSEGTTPRRIPISTLQDRLRSTGALI